MNNLRNDAHPMLEHAGERLSQELGDWAADRDQLGRARARLLRQRFRAETKPSRAWLWAPVGAVCAAAAVVLLSLPRPLSYTVNGQAPEAQLREDKSNPAVVRFSDGSELIARPGTRFAIEDVTAHGARVELRGGGLDVSIAHRERATWTVNAGPFQVAVTGTRFVVGWDEQTASMAVNLSEGSVTVTGACIAERRLVPGESLSVSCQKPTRLAVIPGAPEVKPGQAEPLSMPSQAELLSVPAPVEVATPSAEPAAPLGKRPAIGAEDSLRRELTATAEVRRELERDPARALELSDASRVKFPGGALAEEREALAVFALDKLGQKAALRTRAERFLVKFPQGPFSAKVRRILEHAAVSSP